MATTSIWRVKGWLGKVVIYVENPDKTENPAFYEKQEMTERQAQGLSDVIDYAVNSEKTQTTGEATEVMQQFISGVNCHPSTAREEMIAVKKRFGKEDGTVAYHGYQSFAPGEATPEMAHEIGVKLAQQLWGDKYQVIVATHLDKDSHLRDGGFLLALSKFNPLDFLATAYVEILRSTPVLVQILIIYYGVFSVIKLPSFMIFGFIKFERFFPGVVAMGMNSGAYLCEIIRSGLQSIDGGQTEAARSLGLTQTQNMRYIILPQAIKNILPAIANEFVVIIKESAITYTIGVQDIMSAVNAVKGATFIIMEPLLVATAIYFCLCFPTSKVIAYFERRMSRGDKR